MRPHERGTVSEDIAAAFLQSRGWTILARRYRINRKEIDIIARRTNTIAFVEVKARAGRGYGHPLEAVTWKKRREIEYVAQAWITRFGHPALHYRFDAIAITWAGHSHTLEHVEHAWYRT
jgi:putative endonuclease